MKKLFIIHMIIFLLLFWKLLQAGTYNFYFYDNEEKKEEQRDPSPSARDDEKARDDSRNEVALPAPIRQPKESSFFTLPEDAYFSMGVSSDFYFPGADRKDMDDEHSLFLRTKFFPLLTLEGSVPFSPYNRAFSLYKGGILIEQKLGKIFSVHLSGGGLYNFEAPRNNVNENTNLSNKPPRLAGYVGSGFKLRLANHLDLSMTVNYVPIHGYIDWYSPSYSHLRGDIFTTAGVAYVF